MNWLRVLLLRLTAGLLLGVVFQAVLALTVLATGTSPVPPWLILALPPLLGIALVFGVIDGWQAFRWQSTWMPLADGRVPGGEITEERIKAAIRSLNTPFSLPNLARRRTLIFLNQLSETMLAARERSKWAWKIYALTWRHIHRYDSLLDSLRAVLKEADTLTDLGYTLGLALLKERPKEYGLAIRLARGSLTRLLSSYPPEQLATLEEAWLIAYRRDRSLRELLLPPLTQRYLETKRRDEQAGRIYIDSFVHLGASGELVEEMRATAEAVESTGGDPELVANLRALSRTRPRPSISVRPSEPGPVVRKALESGEAGVTFDFLPGESEEELEGSDRPVIVRAARADDTGLMDRIGEQEGHRKPGLITAGIAAVVIVILAVTWVFTDGFRSWSDEPEAPSGPTPVRSELPYTVQVAALPTAERAKGMIASLRDQGLDAYLVTTTTNSKTWYRVHVDQFTDIPTAQAFADSIKRLGRIDDYYVAKFEEGVIPDFREQATDSTDGSTP